MERISLKQEVSNQLAADGASVATNREKSDPACLGPSRVGPINRPTEDPKSGTHLHIFRRMHRRPDLAGLRGQHLRHRWPPFKSTGLSRRPASPRRRAPPSSYSLRLPVGEVHASTFASHVWMAFEPSRMKSR